MWSPIYRITELAYSLHLPARPLDNLFSLITIIMAEENSPIVSPSAQPVEAELQAVGADIQPTVEEPPVTDIADAQPAAEAPVIREAQPTAEAAAQPISKAEPAAAVSAPSESTLVVHHLNNSRSQRILWLLVCTLIL